MKWLALFIVIAAAVPADARPGGGGGFSTGRSSSGGFHSSGGGYHSSGGSYHSSGGGGGDASLLVALVVEYPAIIIPLVIIFFAYIIYKAKQLQNQADWSSSVSNIQNEWQPPPRSARRDLLALRKGDANFSLVLFEDFLYALYHEAHVARGAGKLDRLSAYLNVEARARLTAFGDDAVADVIVGTVRLRALTSDADYHIVTVEFGANMSEGGAGVYVEEFWRLRRAVTAQSKPWSRARVLACPSCGAPAEQVLAGVCGTCKEKVGDGRFDWTVIGVERSSRTQVAPILLGGAVEEGTDLPTVVDDEANDAWQALGGNWNQFTQRVSLIFATFQKAWTARDLTPMTPLLSDTLLATQKRWVAAYQKAKLRNVTEGISLTNIQISNVYSDRWFHAVTVRVSGEGPDFTVDEKDKVVGGSKTSSRSFTEYWTLIRSNARPLGDPVVGCPECGAELPLTMAGQCPFCKSAVTAASFDWVLSRIEQDEVYEL